MVFKRLLYNAFAFCLGFSLGMLVASPITQILRLPLTFTNSLVIALIWALLFAICSHFVCKAKLAPGTESDNPDTADLQRQWAWLKPAGVVSRSPYPLNKEQVIIGRDINCDVMLKDESISRRHAEITRGADGWYVRDLGSSNGTFVNGQRKQEVLLCEGDLITLGDINMTFEGPRRPIPTVGQETVTTLPTSPEEALGLETQVHRIDDETEVWRPRRDPDDL